MNERRAPTTEKVEEMVAAHKADASAHHTKYTNAAAKAAAVQAGTITNGVTKAPTHDAVYDVKQVAYAATTPAEVDTKITTHEGDASAHHSKTSDASEIISGILSILRIPDLAASKITSGILAVARIPNLSASKITSGVLALARIPTGIQGKLTGACPYKYSHPGSPVCSGCPDPSGRYAHPSSGTCPQAPKGHTLASHSTKAHGELTGVTASQHHTKYTNTQAVAAVKAGVKLNELQAPTSSVNFNKKQATSFVIENRTSDPASPANGQIWLRTDL